MLPLQNQVAGDVEKLVIGVTCLQQTHLIALICNSVLECAWILEDAYHLVEHLPDESAAFDGCDEEALEVWKLVDFLVGLGLDLNLGGGVVRIEEADHLGRDLVRFVVELLQGLHVVDPAQRLGKGNVVN